MERDQLPEEPSDEDVHAILRELEAPGARLRYIWRTLREAVPFFESSESFSALLIVIMIVASFANCLAGRPSPSMREFDALYSND